MGLGCKLNMMRCVLPSLRSPFTINSSPPCCSTSFRGKELDFGSARLSLLTFGFDESESLRKDTSRPHASSSLPQTAENDYSNLETTISKRPCKGLQNTLVLPEGDTSMYVRSVQACSASHFHVLMENINVLENKVSDSELLKLERDILVQLGRLGALQLFHACLSRTVDMLDLPDQITVDNQVNVRKDNVLKKNVVFSKRKEERKSRQQRRLQATSKKCACRSEISIENSMHHVVSSAAKKTTARSRRAVIAKNEAEMSRGIKVVAQLEKMKSTLEKESGKVVSLKCWAEAAGIDEKVLQHDLHFGWYCRDELLKSGRSLVLYLARYYRGLGIAHEDLMQAGNVGILQGAERFDHTRGYQFSTYVQYWIRKAMSQLVSRHGRGIKVPATLSTTISRIQKARKTLKRSQGKHPDDVEVSKVTGLSLDKIKSADKCLRIVGSLDSKVGDINIKYLECTPDTSLEMPEKTVMKQHMKNDVHKLLKELDPKERRVLILRYGLEGHCMSLHEVGKIFNVSKEWIRKMEKRAFNKLKNEENRRNLKHYIDL
ncbi:RNA polymerase sigma factor sigC-like [Chenopodium quinoa]|uniref:Sigma factor n=1 Tax=Chenopodium quinoa TaxID=63459 RepID=A0A803LBH2_CHEQI|nr:RNA polymerase sigma factor sigC-like [Chenopodium quinoa]